MLTLRRFGALLDRYGAEPGRWPEQERDAAEALVASSAVARALLAEARGLDAAIADAAGQEDAALWPPGAKDAALARLRSGVAARIAPGGAAAHPRVGWQLVASTVAHAVAARAAWFGLAAGSGFAIAAGLLIGMMSTQAATSDDMLTMLQPAPIHILSDAGGQNE